MILGIAVWGQRRARIKSSKMQPQTGTKGQSRRRLDRCRLHQSSQIGRRTCKIGFCGRNEGGMGTAYNVYYCCDKCGATHSWINHSVSLSIAIKMARDDGWSVGKRGWYCPECRRKPKKGD